MGDKLTEQSQQDAPRSNAAPEAAEAACPAAGQLPLGFKDEPQYHQCMSELEDALAEEGVTDATIGVRGSAVTGQSSKGGPFRWVAEGGKAPSDVDVFVESEQLTRGLSESKSIPGFVHPNKVMAEHPALEQWSAKWSGELGREITPGAFKPGTVPEGPKIIWGD